MIALAHTMPIFGAGTWRGLGVWLVLTAALSGTALVLAALAAVFGWYLPRRKSLPSPKIALVVAILGAVAGAAALALSALLPWTTLASGPIAGLALWALVAVLRARRRERGGATPRL